jgi:hypothetical protein
VKNQCKSLNEFKEESLTVRPCEVENEYVELSCSFDTKNLHLLNDTYGCSQQPPTKFNRPFMYIYRVKGNQDSGKTYKDVKGFLSTSSGDFSTFPMNLETFFPNLEGIMINYGRLKEITQQNLMKFPNLKHLNLDSNDIEVLEIDLFASNPLLKVIWFANNKLNSIADESLKNLVHLQDLDIRHCLTQRLQSHADIISNLAQIHQKCPYSSNDALKVLKQREKSLKTKTECLTKSTNTTKN